MGTVTMNGKTYSGNSISIINGVVTIDGKIIDNESVKDALVITIEGSVENIFTDKSVNCSTVNGNIISGGLVTCGNVGGSVESVGSVVCTNTIHTGVNAGGSVTCDNIDGDAYAGGSIIADTISGNAIGRLNINPSVGDRVETLYDRKPKAETILGKIAKAFAGQLR